MRKVAFIAVCAILVASCTSNERRMAGTTAAGAATGAVIGGIANGGRGALVGTAIGGATGAMVGAATNPRECWARDRWGDRVRVRC